MYLLRPSVWIGMLAGIASGFINPIIPGFNPDPTILVVGSDYFISTSTFEFYPGHPIYHSTDLVNWKLIGHGLNTPALLPLYGLAPEGGIWAPTLRHYNGTFYLFTTSRWVYNTEAHQFSRPFYVTTNDIFAQPIVWSDPLTMDLQGYDSDIFVDPFDGIAWVTRTDLNNATAKIYGIYQSQIDLKSGRSISESKLIFNGTLPLNSTARPEGPHLYYKEPYYYLTIAEGGSSVYHQTTVQRGPTPEGPWESYSGNPIIYNGVNPDPTQVPVQWTGHSDMIETASGDWWGVCLGIRPQGGNIARHQLGRETFLYPIKWSSDGWPNANNNQFIGLTGPGLPNISVVDSTSFYDDFSAKTLDLGYYFLRTPYYPSFYAFVGGRLSIQGTGTSLGDRDSPALLLRKQTALNQIWSTEVDFSPKSVKHQAGATVFYSDFFHQDIYLTLCPSNNGSRCVNWQTVVSNNGTSVTFANSTNITVESFPIQTEGTVALFIQAEDVRYNFGYRENAGGGNITWVGSVDSIWLASAPVGYGVYKGAQFGIYASGGETTMWDEPAYFSYVNQTTTQA